jgi:hypothetical protein
VSSQFDNACYHGADDDERAWYWCDEKVERAASPLLRSADVGVASDCLLFFGVVAIRRGYVAKAIMTTSVCPEIRAHIREATPLCPFPTPWTVNTEVVVDKEAKTLTEEVLVELPESFLVAGRVQPEVHIRAIAVNNEKARNGEKEPPKHVFHRILLSKVSSFERHDT